MNSTNNPFLWDKQCPSFLGPMNTTQRENPIVPRKPNSFHDIISSDSRASNITRCDICSLNVPQSYTCSNCSKISCNACTQQWLVGQNIQCPNCHHPLRDSTNSEQENLEICREHKVKVSYYCLTCKVTACADCAMFGDKHRNHQFEKLDQAYGEQMSKITREMDGLSIRLNKLKNCLVTLDSNIAEVAKNKETKLTELSIVTEQMAQRLGTELKSKLAVFIAQKGTINGELEYLQNTQHNLNQQLTTWSKSHLLAKSDETLKSLQQINSKPCQADDVNKVSLSFVSEITPQFDTGFFILKPFSELRQSTEVIYSEPLYCQGLKWRLKVYPDGNGTAKGEYLSVFLEMMEGLKTPSRYEYQVEMINQRNPESVPVMYVSNLNYPHINRREFVSEFIAGECWGYNRFFKINMLEEEGYLVPEQDAILLKFSVRAQTYYQQCQDQKRYIENLEETRRQNEALITELRERLELETKEKENLLKLQQSKTAEISEDLLNAGEIQTVSPKKEPIQEALPINTGSLETIENETPYSDLLHKIRGQKEVSNKAENQKPEKNAFYSLLESNIVDANEEAVETKETGDEYKDKNRASTEDSQEPVSKDKVDLCAQFEVLDPEECSFQDMSLYSSEEEYNEEADEKHSVNEEEHVVTVQNNEEKNDVEEFHEQISHKTHNSSPGNRSEGMIGFEKDSQNDLEDSEEDHDLENQNGKRSGERDDQGCQPDILNKLNELLHKFEKEQDSMRNNQRKDGF